MVVLLRQILNLQLRILLHQRPVFIVYPLRYLSHLVQMLIQFFFSLFEVIVILLFLVLLGLELLLDVIELAVKGRPGLLSVFNQNPSRLVLHITYLFLEVVIMLIDGLNVFLIDVGLVLGLLTALSLESLLVLGGGRIDPHK